MLLYDPSIKSLCNQNMSVLLASKSELMKCTVDVFVLTDAPRRVVLEATDYESQDSTFESSADKWGKNNFNRER